MLHRYIIDVLSAQGIYMYIDINPFKPNGFSHSYELDQPISVLRVVGGIFHFY